MGNCSCQDNEEVKIEKSLKKLNLNKDSQLYSLRTGNDGSNTNSIRNRDESESIDPNIKFNKIVYKDKSEYYGQTKNGMKHGKGKLVDQNGNVYEGDFFENNIEGKGVFTSIDGSVYEGQ